MKQGSSLPHLEDWRSVFPGKTILAASSGGHLTELRRMSQSWRFTDRPLWVTFENEQSRSMLQGEDVLYVPYVAPRDWRGVLYSRALLDQKLEGHQVNTVISTGAGLALSVFTAQVSRHSRRIYIESVTRTNGPSLSGRIVAMLRLAETYTQHPGWSGSKWRLSTGVLDNYRTVPKSRPDKITSIFVTLGTITPYRFDRLMDAVCQTQLVGESTIWQTGSTAGRSVPGVQRNLVSVEDFRRFSQNADVVVTHGGVGSIIELLDLGVSPVVVPRVRRYREHVDDHQSLFCDLLDQHGLGVVVDADSLSAEHLAKASGQATLRANDSDSAGSSGQ